MGFSTTYLGRLDIHPLLNDFEVEWLRAFAAIDRRHYTEPYEVAMNPRALAIDDWQQHQAGSRPDGRDPFKSLSPDDGSPYPYLDWQPCTQGCCLGWERREKSRMAEEWLQYLIDHFLRPGAHARLDGRPEFEPFTFDHVVNGIIAGERDDTGELFLIRCEDNVIRRETLVNPERDEWLMGW
ncbi:hypothetical protein [Flexivirga oryzae]|uniref:Uncharacterized protein n=1 Tax=Flexivirga oryzae TaxID=1794944 RepID=A0A839NAQ3_9MICO|nr:hypothetical protein [Flexivirga oryzae]MBB2891682.1 hypothetical protein [Flexivirga oryzae]